MSPLSFVRKCVCLLGRGIESPADKCWQVLWPKPTPRADGLVAFARWILSWVILRRCLYPALCPGGIIGATKVSKTLVIAGSRWRWPPSHWKPDARSRRQVWLTTINLQKISPGQVHPSTKLKALLEFSLDSKGWCIVYKMAQFHQELLRIEVVTWRNL